MQKKLNSTDKHICFDFKRNQESGTHICFDFKRNQESGTHIVNYAITKYVQDRTCLYKNIDGFVQNKDYKVTTVIIKRI